MVEKVFFLGGGIKFVKLFAQHILFELYSLKRKIKIYFASTLN